MRILTIIGYDYDLLKASLNITSSFAKTSNHEFYPIVSELWYAVMLKYNRTMLYLNSIQIYKHEQISFLGNVENATKFFRDIMDNWQDHAFMLLRECNFFAMMFSGTNVLVIYTNLSLSNAAVFLGKDVVYENIRGYRITGHFPNSIYLWTKYFFEFGIVDHWRKYMDYFLVLRTHFVSNVNQIETLTFNQKSKIAINVLMVIPGVGILVAFMTFLYE